MYYAYVLQSEYDNTFYYGSSEGQEWRLEYYHNRGHERYARTRIPWRLVYKEQFNSRVEAVRREKFFKTGQGRAYIKNVLENL